MIIMKKNIYQLVFAVGVASCLFITFGCEDFLEPEPKTFETKENFFQSEDQFLLSVNSAYARLQEWVLQAHVLLESRSDNTTYDNQLNLGVSQHLARVDWFIPNTDIPQVNNAWDLLFRGIKETNVPLSVIDEAVSNGILDQNLGSRMEGELKFLRAFYYFNAIRLWGDVPLILEPITNGLQAFEIVRSPKNEILGVIKSDLETAVNQLPDTYDSGNRGRATKNAARSLLASVLMWNSEYSNAENTLRNIVNSGMYELLEDYSQIFSPDNKFNSELIFEVGFKEGGEGESSNFIYQFSPVGSFPEVIPTLVGDGVWGKNLPTRELVSAYEEGDKRLEASIGFFDRSDTENIPYIRKWPEATDENFARTNHNWPLFRYSEILLLLAEAVNEQGFSSGEPFELLNRIRIRAGLDPKTPSEIPDQSSFRQALIQERRIELAFENKRWFDLVRFNIATGVIKEHGAIEISNPTTTLTSVLPLDPRAYEVEPFMLLFPIPQNELIVNPNMEQNPGY